MPPPRRRTARHGLSDQLREIIESRGLTAYALGGDAGVDPAVIHRFLTGERDIRLETADRLAGAMRLRLVEVGQGKGRRHSPTLVAADSPGPGHPGALEG